MRMMTFAKRCSKEILRDPINLGFGLGFRDRFKFCVN